MVRLAPELADAKLESLLVEYERCGMPLEVSFRDFLRRPAARDRATHDLHPYPARLLVNIPSFFLATSLSNMKDVVLDPFCGSGTVLLEAILAGRNATGADANPLARLITRTKLTPIDPRVLGAAKRSLFARIQPAPRGEVPESVNLEYWFYPHVRRDLLRLRDAINATRSATLRDFFSVALSACIKDVSLADPRLSVPVRLKKDQYPQEHWLRDRTNQRLAKLRTVNVVKVFAMRLEENTRRSARLGACSNRGVFVGLSSDARDLAHLEPASIDFAITSPPYVGAQKYIRASSLSLGWLGLCPAEGLRALEDCNIGREHYPRKAYARLEGTGLPQADVLLARIRKVDPLRSHIAATYLREMRTSLRELHRVMKPKRHVVLVAGESSVCGFQFPTPLFLTEMAAMEGLGLRLHLVDNIRSRSLMTKRHHTAGVIDTESILLLRKQG